MSVHPLNFRVAGARFERDVAATSIASGKLPTARESEPRAP
jgi:hypothetical protein